MTIRQTIRQGRVVWELLLDGKLLARVESKEQAKRLARMLRGVSEEKTMDKATEPGAPSGVGVYALVRR